MNKLFFLIFQRKGQAKEIFMKYMSPKATDPVNIEHITVKQVEKQLDSPSTSTFEKSQQEVGSTTS